MDHCPGGLRIFEANRLLEHCQLIADRVHGLFREGFLEADHSESISEAFGGALLVRKHMYLVLGGVVNQRCFERGGEQEQVAPTIFHLT